MKNFIIGIIWLGYVWSAAYTFKLFPWGEDMEWWYIPHLFTLAILILPMIKVSAEIEGL